MTQGQASGWFSKNWKWLLALVCLVPVTCCGGFTLLAWLADDEAPVARVDCGTPGPDGVDCEVKRTSGTGAFEACWELEITCTNKAVMVGSGCGKVAEGASSLTVNLPAAGFSNQQSCDAPSTGAVQRLTVEGS